MSKIECSNCKYAVSAGKKIGTDIYTCQRFPPVAVVKNADDVIAEFPVVYYFQ